MTPAEPFTFGSALISRQCADDWGSALAARFGLTLGQIRAVSQQSHARTHKRHEAGRQGAAV